MPKRKRFVATLVLHTFEHVLVVLVGVAGLDPQSLVHDWDASIPALRLGNGQTSLSAALALHRCPA